MIDVFIILMVFVFGGHIIVAVLFGILELSTIKINRPWFLKKNRCPKCSDGTLCKSIGYANAAEIQTYVCDSCNTEFI